MCDQCDFYSGGGHYGKPTRKENTVTRDAKGEMMANVIIERITHNDACKTLLYPEADCNCDRKLLVAIIMKTFAGTES